MDLRCLLFTFDRQTAQPICQVLADLGVEGEHCAEAVAAVERVTSQPFQIVIIDWDAQPEAGLLLTAARERKASERPLTLAIVGDDASVPQALQAGANSILRKPILISQVNDTLTTARDLLRAKQESAVGVAQAAAAGVSATSSTSSLASPSTAFESSGLSAALPRSFDSEKEKTLHPGEFLQTSGSIPGRQFVTDSEVHNSLEPAVLPVDPLKDLEPVAASVAETSAVETSVAKKRAELPRSDEPRGLQWYLNARAVAQAETPAMPAPPRAVTAKPELLGFDQTPSYLENHSGNRPDKHSNNDSNNQQACASDDTGWAPTAGAVSALGKPRANPEREQKAEAKLFAYISGEEAPKPKEKARSQFRLGKGAIIAASVLAACAIAATPQAPWHGQMRGLWGRGQQALHTWLNPQPVTTAQAPESHENFGRAGDEYKMPAPENIPDATTDPSQIRVVPVVDPTAKKPDGAANPDTGANPVDATISKPADTAQPAGGPATGDAAPGSQSPTNPPNQGPTSVLSSSSPGSQTVPQLAQNPNGGSASEAAAVPKAEASQAVVTQPAPANPQSRVPSSPTNVPSSLKSQIASMRPDAGGDKPPEAALQSIEPVVVPEAAERALITEQPAIDFPANAKGQQGTVVLQVLVGRDGTVQDAKFLQGSLAFARTAIEGVKLWKFKPYSMNGRPVSVQTLMTMTFKPGT
jgi:TonB family protein